VDSPPDSMNDSNLLDRPLRLTGDGYKKRGRTARWEAARLKSLFSPPSHPPLSVDVSVMDFKNLSANLTNITNTLAEKPSITTLATILLSFTGLQDWLKLFVIGGVFETFRRVIFQAWDNTVDSLWITVDFEEGDESYGENLAPPVGRSIITVMPARIMY
jgi:hypothetical protein